MTVVSRSKFPSALLVGAHFCAVKISVLWQKLGVFPFGLNRPLPWKPPPESPTFFVPSLLPFASDVGALCCPRVTPELGQLCPHSPFLSPVFRALAALATQCPMQGFVLVCGPISTASLDIDVYEHYFNRLVPPLRVSSFFLYVESLSRLWNFSVTLESSVITVLSRLWQMS